MAKNKNAAAQAMATTLGSRGVSFFMILFPLDFLALSKHRQFKCALPAYSRGILTHIECLSKDSEGHYVSRTSDQLVLGDCLFSEGIRTMAEAGDSSRRGIKYGQPRR